MSSFRVISISAFALTASALLVGCAASAPTIANYDWTQAEAAVNSGGTLIDARSTKGHDAGTIPGSISLPCSSEEAVYAEKLPEDRAKELVFYCGGPKCSASTKGANAALNLGFTKVAVYKPGYAAWKKSQPVAEAPAPEAPAAAETPVATEPPAGE
jgi:rhodanese-related sulfurtransferase